VRRSAIDDVARALRSARSRIGSLGFAGSIANGWNQRAPRPQAARRIAGAALTDQLRPFQRADCSGGVAAGCGGSSSWRKAHRGRRCPLLRRLPYEGWGLLAWQTHLRHNHHDGVSRVGRYKARRPDQHRCGSKTAESDARVSRHSEAHEAFCPVPGPVVGLHHARRYFPVSDTAMVVMVLWTISVGGRYDGGEHSGHRRFSPTDWAATKAHQDPILVVVATVFQRRLAHGRPNQWRGGRRVSVSIPNRLPSERRGVCRVSGQAHAERPQMRDAMRSARHGRYWPHCVPSVGWWSVADLVHTFW
jgi:hypothetical protein